MFASDAAAWEAIACVNVAKAAAVDRCLAKVRQVIQSTSVADPIASQDLMSKAMTAIKIKDWLDLAISWKDVGNDPNVLTQTVSSVSQEAAKAAIQDPLIGQLVADNLQDIGISLTRVQEGFDSTYQELLKEFPNAPTKELQAYATPGAPVLSNTPTVIALCLGETVGSSRSRWPRTGCLYLPSRGTQA